MIALDLSLLSELRFPVLDLSFDWRVFLAYVLGVLILYMAVRLVATPLKETLRLVVNVAVGIVMLLFFNLIGGYFGLHVPLNPVTALVAGLLGVPGVGLMVALQYVVV